VLELPQLLWYGVGRLVHYMAFFPRPAKGEGMLKSRNQEILALESAILFYCMSLHFGAKVESLPANMFRMTREAVYNQFGRNQMTTQALKNLCQVQLWCADTPKISSAGLPRELRLNKASLSRMHRLLEEMALPTPPETKTEDTAA
jgi:hypothetical protein